MENEQQLTGADVLRTDGPGRAKELLASLGWSQSKLARRAGVSQQAISLFLMRKRRMSPAVSDRVLTALEAETAAEGGTDKLSEFAHLMALAAPRDPAAYARWRERMVGTRRGNYPTDPCRTLRQI